MKSSIEKVREAFENGNVYSVSFNHDGSGISVYYYDPVGYHGTPCTCESSFNSEEASTILSGFNLKIK